MQWRVTAMKLPAIGARTVHKYISCCMYIVYFNFSDVFIQISNRIFFVTDGMVELNVELSFVPLTFKNCYTQFLVVHEYWLHA